MKPSLYILFAILVSGLFGGCSKIGDFRFNNPGADEHLCNIEKFTVSYSGQTSIYNVLYDGKGNPVEIKPSNFTTGLITRFSYDKKGNLTTYRLDNFSSPTDSVIIYVHHYYYAPNGRFIVDTPYLLPAPPTFPIPPGFIPPFEKLALDAEGRVIRDSFFGSNLGNLSGPGSLQDLVDYTYDAKGNLVSAVDEFFSFFNLTYGAYDDKVNYRQTNRTWQLLDRNYSRNNYSDPAGSASVIGYTSFGLPKEIKYTPKAPNAAPAANFLPNSPYVYSILDLQYACDVPGGDPGKY